MIRIMPEQQRRYCDICNKEICVSISKLGKVAKALGLGFGNHGIPMDVCSSCEENIQHFLMWKKNEDIPLMRKKNEDSNCLWELFKTQDTVSLVHDIFGVLEQKYAYTELTQERCNRMENDIRQQLTECVEKGLQIIPIPKFEVDRHPGRNDRVVSYDVILQKNYGKREKKTNT